MVSLLVSEVGGSLDCVIVLGSRGLWLVCVVCGWCGLWLV